jgi:hypothetical protein
MIAPQLLPPKTRPELQLLLACARTTIDSASADQIRSLVQGNIDWTFLTETVFNHGTLPLLYQSLHTICPDAVPVAALEALREAFYANAGYNLYLSGELFRILRLFDSQGIPVLPFKGPVLATSLYGNLALRQFVDLDLLIRRQHLPQARQLLYSLGYQSHFGASSHPLTRAQEAAYLRSHCDISFARDQRAAVELHWRFIGPYFSFQLDHERLWERLELSSFGDSSILSLKPEDLLLILCVHGTKHFWERLLWICDIAELVRVHGEMNWRLAIEQARALGCERMLLLGLYLAHDLLGMALPGAVLERALGDSAAMSLAAQVGAWLFDETSSPSGEWPFAQRFHLRARERAQDRARYLLYWATIPTMAELGYLQLPETLSFLYYLLRPIRVVKRCGDGLWKRLQRASSPRDGVDDPNIEDLSLVR